MILGNGMIASAMKTIENTNFIFFCSGVSKSNEIDESAYLREKELLAQYYDTTKCLIYFSSYFVNFESYLAQRYYLHKLEMEHLIQENFKLFKIFRLPQVVGYSTNKHTLTNFLHNAIVSNLSINVYQGAQRNLIDLDDVVKVIEYTNQNNLFMNQSVNLIATQNYKIEDVIDVFEKIIGKKAIQNIQPNQEKKFDILLSKELTQIYNLFKINFDENYLYAIVIKYYKSGSEK